MSPQELKRLIQIQKQGGASLDEARSIIEAITRSNGAYPIEQALATLESVFKESKDQTLSASIAEYVHSVTQGDINVTDLDKECEVVTKRDRDNRRQILHRLCETGILERKSYRVYRLANIEAPEIDIDSVDPNAPAIDIKLPFNIHEFVDIYPKNIILYAGDWDAGKTALCFETLWLNRDNKMPMTLFNSEMGAEELARRLRNKNPDKWWSFKIRERDRDFADVIKPDHINVIDYIEFTDNFFLIAEELKQITAKLRKGIAIVCLQKKSGAELAYGGDTTAWKARLYLTISYDKESKLSILKVKKAKNPKMASVNIKGWEWKFRISGGVHIDVVEEPDGVAEWGQEESPEFGE